MIELNLNLKSFNGPLDLLLSLVKDNKMDINAIDIELLADEVYEVDNGTITKKLII